MPWKVVIVGPTGAALTDTAFGLLYSFPTKEEAEAHAECFGFAGMKIVPCEEPEKLADDCGTRTD
ncbi:MAG: hypothetical protein WCA19_01925 [Candidatus Acidiferrales bacterium]